MGERGWFWGTVIRVIALHTLHLAHGERRILHVLFVTLTLSRVSQAAVLLSVAATCGAFAPSLFAVGVRGRAMASIAQKPAICGAFPQAGQRLGLESSHKAAARSQVLMQAATGSFGVVVTGGAGGVGFAYADEFLNRGHRVVICDISPKIADAAAALQVHLPQSKFEAAAVSMIRFFFWGMVALIDMSILCYSKYRVFPSARAVLSLLFLYFRRRSIRQEPSSTLPPMSVTPPACSSLPTSASKSWGTSTTGSTTLL